MDGSGSTPTKPVPASRRGRKPSRALQIIVECAAVVSKHSSATLRVDGYISSENMFNAPTSTRKR